MRDLAIERLEVEFGSPLRDLVKVRAWNVTPQLGIVLQMDQPRHGEVAFIWLPYPRSGVIPEIALEYAGESGRHSGTYPTPGLARGEPALKAIVRTPTELEGLISYIKAMASAAPLPKVSADKTEVALSGKSPSAVGMPCAPEPKPRREAIPRVVQREVWQRDAGRCVECASKEFLCFDHIVPFSRGGSNTVRNIQLLCERCNLSKGNRI